MAWQDLKSKGLPNMPGVPEASNYDVRDTLSKLNEREGQLRPAVDGLSYDYVIGGHAARASDFLFGNPQLRNLFLDDPRQFAISWTIYKDVHKEAIRQLDFYANTLTSVPDATEGFWPMIARYGTPYNLLILRRVTDTRFAALKPLFGQSDLHVIFEPVQRQGRLYEIDFSMFENLGSWGFDDGKPERYNPATLTLLERDEKKIGVFEPKWIYVRNVSRHEQNEFYSPLFIHQKGGSWLYALQAAKTSVTLYGISEDVLPLERGWGPFANDYGILERRIFRVGGCGRTKMANVKMCT
jgi:hypothetical protein